MPRKKKLLDPDRYVSTETLADMLGLGVRTLWRRIDDGLIPPPAHRGRPNYFDIDAVLGHVEQRDPWLSCQLAGGVGHLRGYRNQSRKLWQMRVARQAGATISTTGEVHDNWATTAGSNGDKPGTPGD